MGFSQGDFIRSEKVELKENYTRWKITTFRHIHFYLLFDVSSVTTLIVKKLL